MSSANTFKITKAGILKSWEGNPQEAVIPDGVVEIGKKVFYSCNKLSRVVIPDGVKVIGESAFQECTHLAEVTLPDSLEIIGDSAFFFTPLKNIAIPPRVTAIGSAAFALTLLESVVIPPSVTAIGTRAFNALGGLANKGMLTDVTILGSEVAIGGKAFPEGFGVRLYAPNAPLSQFAAEYKRQIIFTYLTGNAEYPPERVAEYHKYIDKTDDFMELLIKGRHTAALGRLLEIKSKVNSEKLDGFLALAENDPEMKAALLAYQAKMVSPQAREKAQKRKTDIALGEKTRTVAEWKKLFGFEKRKDGLVITSYKGYEDIAEVPEKIGKDTVVAIGEYAFSSFASRVQNKEARRNLRQVTLPETIREIGKNAFYYASRLKSINLPDGVEKIGDCAFYSCENLSSIVIPKSIASVERIFIDCVKLKSAVISDGVTGIGSVAFSGCTALAEIFIPASVTSIHNSAFYRCPNVTIHGKAGSYAESYAKENNIPFVAE